MFETTIFKECYATADMLVFRLKPKWPVICKCLNLQLFFNVRGGPAIKSLVTADLESILVILVIPFL